MSNHHFHIPVMGTGFSIDTPLRVAPLGIDSVLSLVDDDLIERIRGHLSESIGQPFTPIARRDPDSRARRIAAYLDLLHDQVQERFEHLKSQALTECEEKRRYFELLPEDHPLKQLYRKVSAAAEGLGRLLGEDELDAGMVPGSIDVNIMSKLDAAPRGRNSEETGPEYSDALTALRGFAESRVNSALVISAGINKKLFRYATQFREFYRDAEGNIRKKLVLKVSSFRSALSQGRFLARLGLEVHEYRLESGLNCGGHAFGSAGRILPLLLEEFREKREELREQLAPLVRAYYQEQEMDCPEEGLCESLVTVQGGIGTSGEHTRLMEDFGVDRTGWASPFLLVPEVTRLDKATRDQLAAADSDDLYLSDASPLGIPFNNLRSSASERWTNARHASGKSGSPCPKGFLVSSKEFGEVPLCTASRGYQKRKIEALDKGVEGGLNREELMCKACICDHLGNGILVELGMETEAAAPTAVCPGPNIAWFDRTFTLDEMVGHIYGRLALTSPERPHMFLSELELNMEQYEKSLRETSEETNELRVFRANLEEGIEYCETLHPDSGRPGENMASLASGLAGLRRRMERSQESLDMLAGAQRTTLMQA